MKSIFLTAACLLLVSSPALAAKQTIGAADTGSQSRTKLNANFTELYDGKSDKTAVVRYWSDWPTTGPNNVLAVDTIVAYGGSLYKVTQELTKTGSTADPETLTAYFSEVTGGSDYTLPTATDTVLGGVKVGARLSIADGVLSADVQSGGESITVGDGTTGPFLDGTSDGGTLIKLYGPSTYWTALQAGNALANRSWRLPIDAPPSAGTTRLMNMDEYGQMGFVDPATFATPTGSAASMTVVATGFDGNLTTTDNTLQEIAQKVDDLNISGAAHNAVTLGTDADVLLGLSTQQLTLDSQTANYVFAAPNGSAGDPTFRALVAADIPTLTRAKISDLGTSAQYDVGTSIGNIVRLADSGGNPALPFTINLFDLNDGNAGAIDVPGVAGQVMTFGTNGAMTWATPLTTSSFDDTPDNGSTSTAPTANWAFDHAALTMSDTVVGHVEAATTAETSTGTSTTLAVTPDGLSGSVYGQKEIGWFVTASGTATSVADGTQAAVVPASMNGMNLVDLTCSVHALNSAASGATTVVLRRVRGATAVDMTSTGVTINYDEYTASDETVDTSNDDVATGDKIYVDVNAITSAAHQGLSCTAIFQTP